MAFLILFAASFAVVVAGGYAPAADNAASYPNSGYAYVPAYHDRSDKHHHRDRDHHKDHFRKLKDLDGVTVDAEIKYYKHKGEYYAVISCKRVANNFMWILANSDETIPSGFGETNTVALSGGINAQFVAKYSHGKWTGKDYKGGDKHKFRKVGCFKGTLTSGLVAA